MSDLGIKGPDERRGEKNPNVSDCGGGTSAEETVSAEDVDMT
jgi:hypothetical protein